MHVYYSVSRFISSKRQKTVLMNSVLTLLINIPDLIVTNSWFMIFLKKTFLLIIKNIITCVAFFNWCHQSHSLLIPLHIKTFSIQSGDQDQIQETHHIMEVNRLKWWCSDDVMMMSSLLQGRVHGLVCDQRTELHHRHIDGPTSDCPQISADPQTQSWLSQTNYFRRKNRSI